VEFALGDFECRIESGQLVARPLVHYATAEEAKGSLVPLLEDWKAELELGHGRQIAFTQPQVQMVDRNPSGGGYRGVELTDVVYLQDVPKRIESSTWPSPPAGKIRNTPFVELLRTRRLELIEGHGNLSALAYWLVTTVGQHFGGSEKAASDALGVSRHVLEMIRQLSSRNDPQHGRKASSGAPKPLTPAELGWLRAAFDAVLVRAAEADSRTEARPLITMADLPSL
jgi:hypothetical protein